MRTLIFAPLAACSVAATAFAASYSSAEAERAALNRQQAEIVGTQIKAGRKAHDREMRAYNRTLRAHQAREMRYQQQLARYEAKREAYELRKAAYQAAMANLELRQQANSAPQPVGTTQTIEAAPALQPAAFGLE